jgi:hypothetical protein
MLHGYYFHYFILYLILFALLINHFLIYDFVFFYLITAAYLMFLIMTLSNSRSRNYRSLLNMIFVICIFDRGFHKICYILFALMLAWSIAF